MKFGAHVSIAGGVFNAPARAAELGCEVFQMFTRSPQGGAAPKLTDETVSKFKSEMKANNQSNCYVHAPYYLNLANPARQIRSNTARIVREELERASVLGAVGVMFHIGSARDVDEATAHKYVIEGLNKIMDGYKGSAKLLIENSAGAGLVMGDTFEEIGLFIRETKRGKELGVCLDTQHMFASGYDIRDKTKVNKMIKEFDQAVGLKHLVVIHANDSMTELGSHKDRHEHIGHGKIGKAGFAALIQHPKLKQIDLVLETPHKPEGGVVKDLKLLKTLRKNK